MLGDGGSRDVTGGSLNRHGRSAKAVRYAGSSKHRTNEERLAAKAGEAAEMAVHLGQSFEQDRGEQPEVSAHR